MCIRRQAVFFRGCPGSIRSLFIQGCRKVQFLLCPWFLRNLVHSFCHHSGQHMIVLGVIAASKEFYFQLCLRHHGRAFCNLHKTFIHIFHHFSGKCPHVIPYHRLIRHYVGRHASVHNSVVDTHIRRHMFPQVIGTDISQLHSIQSASSVFRRIGRMGRLAVKMEFGRVHCRGNAHCCLVDFVGMEIHRHI